MKRLRIALPLAGVLTLAACSAGATDLPDGDSTTVTAAFYALEFAAQQVVGDDANVVNLTSAGSDPHDAEVSPQLMATMGRSELVVHLEGFQPPVDEAIAQSGADYVLDVSEVIELQWIGDEGGHDHGDHDDHDGHDHGPQDPHFWTDPILMSEVTTAIADELATLDPQGAEQYLGNARDAESMFLELDQKYRTGLAECERRAFIPQHAAFAYMAERYGLEQISVAGLAPDEEPSPGRIAEIQTRAREHGITTIFFEPGYPDAIARSIADDLGLETATLDTVESLTPESGNRDYVDIMENNLEALRSANGCT